MSKLKDILVATGTDKLAERGERAFSTVDRAAQTKKFELEGNVDTIKGKIDQHTDLGVQSRDSLNPLKEGFDATRWVNTLHTLKMDLKAAQEELDIYNATFAEWFDEATTTPVA